MSGSLRPMASFFDFSNKERLRAWTNLGVGAQMGVFGNGQQLFLIITRAWYQLSFLLGKLSVFLIIFMDSHLPAARYSTDFFDTKHQVAVRITFLELYLVLIDVVGSLQLGASYATIPRLGRRTVRNFYQHNYPYPWIGARVVYDC